MNSDVKSAIELEGRIDDSDCIELSSRLIASVRHGTATDLMPLLSSKKRSARLEGLRILAESGAPLMPVYGSIKSILDNDDLVLRRTALSTIIDNSELEAVPIDDMLDNFCSSDEPIRRCTRIWLIYATAHTLEQVIRRPDLIGSAGVLIASKLLDVKKGRLSTEEFEENYLDGDVVFREEFKRLKALARKKGAIP